MTEGAYLRDRIRAKCIEDGDCLIWQGDKTSDKKRPLFYNVEGKRKNLRHMLWVEKNGGEPKKGRRIGVSCDRDCCVADEHLIDRTRTQELKGIKRTVAVKAKIAKARRKNSKYSDEWVAMVRDSEKGHLQLAKELGVHYQTISRIRSNGMRRDYTANHFAGLGAR
jgi:hypothetical protein